MGRGFWQDLRSVFVDDFKDAVRETAGVPVVFLDPDKFNRRHYESTGSVHPDDVQRVREMLEEQLPGITNGVSNADLETAVQLSLTSGPFAVRAEMVPPSGSSATPVPICIVNEPGRLMDHKNELMPMLSRQDLERIREIPGWDDHWDRIIGIHEGTHCNDPPLNTSGMTPDQLSTEVLRSEVRADQASIDWARRNGLNEIAQAMIDYRALGAADDPLHATAILIDRPGPVTIDHLNAARDFRGEMIAKVAADQGLSVADAEKMLQDKPEEFNGHIKRLLSSGAFDGNSNPHVKESIQAFSGAVDRQITGRRIEREQEHERQMRNMGPRHHGALEAPSQPGGQGLRLATSEPPEAPTADTRQRASLGDGAGRYQTASYTGADAIVMPSAHADMDVSTINGGTPVVALNSGDKASMTIGGVAPSAFFASHADNDLALQRVALAQEADVGLERDFQRSTPSVSASYGVA